VGPLQRPVADDSRAQKGGSLDVREHVGKAISEGLGGHRVLGEPTVGVPARERRVAAQVLAPESAHAASTARTTQPGNSHSLADREALGTRTSLDDSAHHLVSGNGVRTPRNQVVVGEVEVGAAHTAHASPEQDVPGTRTWNVS
jgi:hypothetical protein